MERFEENYKYGKKSECDILPIISNFFKREIHQSEDPYAKHDFYDTCGNRYELRTRKFNKDTFPDTVVAEDKAHCKMGIGEQLEGDLFFLFRFTDGLYYIQFDLLTFENIPSKIYSKTYPRMYGDRLKYDRKRNHFFIPVNMLTPIIILD